MKKILYCIGIFALIVFLIAGLLGGATGSSNMVSGLLILSPFMLMTTRKYFNIALGKSETSNFSNLSLGFSIISLIAILFPVFTKVSFDISEKTLGLFLMLPALMPTLFIIPVLKISKLTKWLVLALLICVLSYHFLALYLPPF